MTIVRSESPSRDFTILSNEITRCGLSFAAIGLLFYLLSKPSNWRTNAESLASEQGCGPKSIRNIMKELQDHGYMQLEKVQNEKGHWASIWHVFDSPKSPSCPKPTFGQPSCPKRGFGQGQPILRTELTSTKNTNTNTKISPICSEVLQADVSKSDMQASATSRGDLLEQKRGEKSDYSKNMQNLSMLCKVYAGRFSATPEAIALAEMGVTDEEIISAFKAADEKVKTGTMQDQSKKLRYALKTMLSNRQKAKTALNGLEATSNTIKHPKYTQAQENAAIAILERFRDTCTSLKDPKTMDDEKKAKIIKAFEWVKANRDVTDDADVLDWFGVYLRKVQKSGDFVGKPLGLVLSIPVIKQIVEA